MRTLISTATLVPLSLVCVCLAASTHGSEPNVKIEFNRDIRPILSDACFACHGPDKHARQADLRLDDRAAALESGAIVERDVDASAIIARILSDDPELVMPPPKTGKTLTAEQVELLKRWIAEGAPYEAHWSFVPVPHTIPKPTLPSEWSAWPKQDLDAFVLEELLERGWQPAAPADPLRWLRRVRLDLTGLPPTPEEVHSLLNDPSETNRERIVDQLLASDAYGERMANMWLDVARYADTFGYQADVNMDVWPWRDWVIRAFRSNLPYDQFVQWQIAGDMFPEATDDQRLATTFNRLHRQTNEGGSIEEEFRQVYVADRTVTAGTAFLGLTLECSRCHDHKYDPISQRDFYSLASYFADIDEHGLYSHFTRGTPTPALALYDGDQKQKHAELLENVRQLENQLAALIESRKKDWHAERGSEVSATAFQPPSATWSFGLEGSEPGVFETATRFNGDDAASFPLHRTEGDDPNKKVQAQLGRTDPFTISVWVKPAQHADRVILVHQCHAAEDSAFRGLQLVLQQGKPQFSLIHFWPGDAIRVEALQAIPIDAWTHLCITYDGSSRASGIAIWINGQRTELQVDRDQLTRDIRHRGEWGDAVAGSVPISVGARFRDIGFRDGCMDELQIFDRELATPDVLGLYTRAPFVTEEVRNELAFQATQSFDPRLLRGDSEYDRLVADLQKARTAENEFYVHVRQIMAMSPPKKHRITHILERGAYDAPRAAVMPATPAALPDRIASSDSAKEEKGATSTTDRLALARWMTSDKNPLVSRVAVNRFWSLFMGRGLVATLEDFGSQGQPPSHPKLLDALARRFMNQGWNVKQLCKEIVLSATYAQSSSARQSEWETTDPDNKWLARGPRHRLSAEQVRDAALFVSGQLVPKVGGPSVMPYQPPGLWEESGTGKSYHQAQGEGLYRRSMYTFWRRTAPPPSMLAFDATSRETCTARRETTNTPLQALVLLNDPQFVEAARASAELALRALPDDVGARCNELSIRILGRPLSPEECRILVQTYDEQLLYFESAPESTQAFLRVGDRPADANLPPHVLAATTVVAETLLCFDDFVMKR